MVDYTSPPLSPIWPFFRPTKRLIFTFGMIESALEYALEDCRYDFDKLDWKTVFDDFLFQKEAGLTPCVTKHFRELYKTDPERVEMEIYLIIRRLRKRCAQERPDLYPPDRLG